LRKLRDYLATRNKDEGEVLAAFVVNATTDHHQLLRSAFESVVGGNRLDGALQNLYTARVLTDEEHIIALGTKHATALEKLCEFFTPGDYQAAKRVLRERLWDSVIPQDL
jgi:hypothetical protein